MHPSALPKVGAAPPRPPWGGRSAPPTPGLLRGWQPLHPPAGAPREHGFAMLGTRVTFPTRGKSPKARQGLRPLESPGAWSPPFSRSLTHRAGLPSDTTKDRFATLRWWANRSCFFLWFHQGNTLCFQSVARQGCPRGCLKVSVLATNTARAESRGNPRGSSPLCRRSRNQEVPGESLVTFFSQESHPGWRGGAPPQGEECRGWGAAPPRKEARVSPPTLGREKKLGGAAPL